MVIIGITKVLKEGSGLDDVSLELDASTFPVYIKKRKMRKREM